MKRLYHFTCAHGHKQIAQTGVVVPWTRLVSDRPAEMCPPPVAWFTDLPRPEPQQVGLTQELVRCDRLAYRYVAREPRTVVPWHQWRAEHRDAIDLAWLEAAESGGEPDHWFVSASPVKVRRA